MDSGLATASRPGMTTERSCDGLVKVRDYHDTAAFAHSRHPSGLPPRSKQSCKKGDKPGSGHPASALPASNGVNLR